MRLGGLAGIQMDLAVKLMYNVHMVSLGAVKFVWDETKNAANKRKHGISFDEALTVFFSAPLLVFHDPEHSEDEERYIAFGISASTRVLAVVHCESESGKIVRIISARKATKLEQKKFFGGMK
jgi:uncharacterized DUF497 family protein